MSVGSGGLTGDADAAGVEAFSKRLGDGSIGDVENPFVLEES